MNTLDAINDFEKTIKANCTKEKIDFNGFADKIVKIKKMNPPVYEKDKINVFLNRRATAISELLNKYIQAYIGKEYPLIDESLFKFKRYLYMNKESKVVKDITTEIDKGSAKAEKIKKVEVPLFIYCPLNQESVEIGKYQRRTGWSHYRTTISASLPKPPREIMAKANTALANYYRVMSKLYGDDRINDLLTQAFSPQVGAIWIPTIDNLTVKTEIKNVRPKNADPALVLVSNDQRYLVGTWNIKEEYPFEHFLKEFTI